MPKPAPRPKESLVPVLLVLAVLWYAQRGPVGPTPPVVVPSTKAVAATYVYEKDQGTPPPPVMAGLNRLNRERKILATIFEQDTKDGTGEIPEQYKAAVTAAKEAGLPALVVTASGAVVKVVKAPTTEAAVWEAVP